jgi:hypothetical protein
VISHNVIALTMSPTAGTEDGVDYWFETVWGRQMLAVEGFEWESKHLLAATRGTEGAPRYLVLYGLTPGSTEQAVAALNELLADGAVLHPDIDSTKTAVGKYDLKAYYQFMDPDPIGRPGDL